MLNIFILTLILSSTLSYSIPSYIHLCKRNDPELDKCFVNTMNEMRPYLKKGIPEMNLPPIEPLKIDSIKFHNGNNPNSALDIEIIDVTVENLSNYNVTKFAIDLSKKYYAIQIHFKNTKLNSKFNIKGNLLIFNLDQGGDFKLEIGEIIANLEWHGKLLKKKDKEHFHFSSSNITTELYGFTIQVENLFHDKALTENFNSIISKNSHVLLPEFSPIVNEIISTFTLKYLNAVYDAFSLDVLYPND